MSTDFIDNERTTEKTTDIPTIFETLKQQQTNKQVQNATLIMSE